MTIHHSAQPSLPFRLSSEKKPQQQTVFNTGAIKQRYLDETLGAMIAVQDGRAGECFSLRADRTKRPLRRHVIDFTDPNIAQKFIEKHGVPDAGKDSKTLTFECARFLILPPQRGLHEEGLALKPVKLNDNEAIMPIITGTATGCLREENKQRLQLVVARELSVVPIERDYESDPQSYRLFIKQAMPLASVSLDSSFATTSIPHKRGEGYIPTA